MASTPDRAVPEAQTFKANGLGFVTEDDLPPSQWQERETLLRVADELDALALQTDAAGRLEGPSLRADAAILRRIGQDKGNLVFVGSEPSEESRNG